MAVVDNVLDFTWWLQNATSRVQWIEAQNLIGVAEIWKLAARKETDVALDVVIEHPEKDFADLYRLVDVSKVRDVRVTIKTKPGFFKALKLATSLALPVRLLPVNMPRKGFEELEEALEFYLHNPGVEAPVEFFHSALAFMRGNETANFWRMVEDDPTVFERWDSVQPPSDAEEQFLKYLKRPDRDCRKCRWLDLCAGYFKQWDPNASCKGILRVYDRLKDAADEMDRDLSSMDGEAASGATKGE